MEIIMPGWPLMAITIPLFVRYREPVHTLLVVCLPGGKWTWVQPTWYWVWTSPTVETAADVSLPVVWTPTNADTLHHKVICIYDLCRKPNQFKRVSILTYHAYRRVVMSKRSDVPSLYMYMKHLPPETAYGVIYIGYTLAIPWTFRFVLNIMRLVRFPMYFLWFS